MKINSTFFLCISFLIIHTQLACGQKNEQGKYKEILETSYELNLDPSAKESKYNKKQTRLFTYKNDHLIEELVTQTHGKAKTASKYLYTYKPNGQLETKTYFIGRELKLTMVETMMYDSNGEWSSIERHHQRRNLFESIQVTTRNDSILIAESFGGPKSLKVEVTNDGKDSIVYQGANYNQKINPRYSKFEKNQFGHITSEHSFNTTGDSLLFHKETSYHYPNKSSEWYYSISKIRASNWQNKELLYRDSIVREVTRTTERTNILQNNLIGLWNMQTPKPSQILLTENMFFEIIQNNKVTGAGLWKLNEREKEFSLIFEKGVARGQTRKYQIIDILEDKLVMKEGDEERIFIREK